MVDWVWISFRVWNVKKSIVWPTSGKIVWFTFIWAVTAADNGFIGIGLNFYFSDVRIASFLINIFIQNSFSQNKCIFYLIRVSQRLWQIGRVNFHRSMAAPVSCPVRAASKTKFRCKSRFQNMNLTKSGAFNNIKGAFSAGIATSGDFWSHFFWENKHRDYHFGSKHKIKFIRNYKNIF